MMKVRILCKSKHSIPNNVFVLNKITEFSKLLKICSRTRSVSIYKIQSILVPPTFGLCSTTLFALATALSQSARILVEGMAIFASVAAQTRSNYIGADMSLTL